jgi:hypothetical protein
MYLAFAQCGVEGFQLLEGEGVTGASMVGVAAGIEKQRKEEAC